MRLRTSAFKCLHLTCLSLTKDLFKGQLPRQLCAQHHHPRHPEEEEVTARLQNGARVEALKVIGLWKVKVWL